MQPRWHASPDAAGQPGEDLQNPSTNEVYYYSAGTDVPLTPTRVLRQLANFAGVPNGTDTQWGFRVMAINSVVERNVEDGTIDEADGDGIWSLMIRVNNAKDLDALPKPTLEADRHTPSDRGRTGIELDWKVAGSDGDHRRTGSNIRQTALTGRCCADDEFLAPGDTAADPPADQVAPTPLPVFM